MPLVYQGYFVICPSYHNSQQLTLYGLFKSMPPCTRVTHLDVCWSLSLLTYFLLCRYDKIRVPAPHPSVVSLPSPEPQRVKTAPLCRSSLAMYSPQTQRFTMEQLALEQAKLLKKMTAVQSHRVDHRYYVSGRQKQIANRYDVNSEQYHVLITMANQRRQYSGHHIGHRHSHLHKSMPPMDKDVEIEVVSSSNKVCREGDLLQCEDGANPQISPRQVVVRTPEVDHESVPYNENDAVQENHRPTKSVEFKEVTQQGTAANVGDKGKVLSSVRTID